MNADDDTYDDPGQRPKVYADTGADKDRVKREGAGQRLNSTLPPPPSELQPPINRLAAVKMPPPIRMKSRPAEGAEDQQRPFSNIYAATLSDTEVVRDFINEQRETIAKMGEEMSLKNEQRGEFTRKVGEEIAGLLGKLRIMGIALALLTIISLASMGGLAYGEINLLREIIEA